MSWEAHWKRRVSLGNHLILVTHSLCFLTISDLTGKAETQSLKTDTGDGCLSPQIQIFAPTWLLPVRSATCKLFQCTYSGNVCQKTCSFMYGVSYWRRGKICRKSLGTGDGREQREFYRQWKSIGIAVMAKLPAGPLAPVASNGHSEDRGAVTYPCAWGAEEEQDECRWHKELHLSCSSSAEGELVYGRGNLYPSKAACLSLPGCWQTPLEP